jgi:hypothetical protein
VHDIVAVIVKTGHEGNIGRGEGVEVVMGVRSVLRT